MNQRSNSFPLDYDSPVSLKAYLDAQGLGMQKKFGQNFLVNRTIRERLVNLLGAAEGDSVWEVGPGLGSMTALLLDRRLATTAFEIDRGFAASVRTFFSSDPLFRLVEGDALRTWKVEATERGVPKYFFGNLPYNIAATLMGDLIEGGAIFERAVVTVQKEVAQRMAAKPKDPDYSSFTVLVSSAYDARLALSMKPGSFWPRPNVDSAGIVMNRKENPPQPLSELRFRSLVKGLFVSRRKTVKNNLETWLRSLSSVSQDGIPSGSVGELAAAVLQTAGVHGIVRAETLTLEEFVAISDAVSVLADGESR